MDEICKARLHELYEEDLFERAEEAGDTAVKIDWNRKLEQYRLK